MAVSAAMRMKALRHLLALTREAFCELIHLPYTRVANLENDRANLSVEDLAALLRVFPEFNQYLIFGEALDVALLEGSSNERCQAVAYRIKNGDLPEGFGLEEVIVNGSYE
jgi:transcriptional regulator with XRE-family HTH domain